MAFAAQLDESLQHREQQAPLEFANGDGLGAVLERYLLAVEAAADTEMLTSILLLEGTQLRHTAAPNLPQAYCEAIDGVEIGPNVGSCGTAAYLGRPIYVIDIATDPLWVDYRAVALEHGLRACWSTPICDANGAVIGTFAIYHPTRRTPTREEVAAIRTITGHVARAILWSAGKGPRSVQPAAAPSSRRPVLELVAEANEGQSSFRDIEGKFEELARIIDEVLDAASATESGTAYVGALTRARKAAEKGAALARSGAQQSRLN
jgi:hypothetical protein